MTAVSSISINCVNYQQNASPKNKNVKNASVARNHDCAKQPQMNLQQSRAYAAQHVSFKGIPENKPPHLTEDDINIAVTCCGHGNIKGNKREVFDFRASMNNTYGFYWYKNFKNPHIIHNGNVDEKRNGETTALVIPLHPNSDGIRGNDNMTLLLNGNIAKDILNELVLYMAKAGILNKEPLYNVRYYVNSTNPRDFMSNPKIKTIIANFFRSKEIEYAKKITAESEANKKLQPSDINIVNIDRRVDQNNTREVKDYLREFLKNDKKMTVVYDKYTNSDNIPKDMTAILIPSKKSQWDCITVTIDKKIPQDECKNLINHLVRIKSANVENENFRNAIVDYLNNL